MSSREDLNAMQSLLKAYKSEQLQVNNMKVA